MKNTETIFYQLGFCNYQYNFQSNLPAFYNISKGCQMRGQLKLHKEDAKIHRTMASSLQ